MDGRPINARPDRARPGAEPGEVYPMVVPTVYGVDGNTVYLHGSVASRSLFTAPRTTICVTVTHLDGLVLARSVFEHAVNYRAR